jgi:hypothetical protein
MASEAQTSDAVRQKPSATLAVVIVAVILCGVAAIAAVWIARPYSGEPASPSIADTVPTTEPSENTQAALIVLGGATMVRRDPGAYGSYHVAYGLTAPHPATNVIQQISSRLNALGWKPLNDDWLNAQLPSSHVRGWTEFGDRTTSPVQRVHLWKAQWQDQAGNIVDYSFRYSYPMSGAPNLNSLWVNASWYPASGVKIMQAPTQ